MANQDIYIPWEGWTLVKLLGHGSFGSVYEIERYTGGRRENAAMKVVPITSDRLYDMYGSSYDDETARMMCEKEQQSIRKEYDIMYELRDNPNIVRCDDFRVVDHPDGIGCDVYIMMECLTSLHQIMKNGSFGEDDVFRMGEDICRALIACEKHQIIHRDIKPQNILVSGSGTYKLGDFGTARKFEKTSSATIAGTEMYMAPEIMLRKKYGRDVDTYSLGLVMHRMLNHGQPPFIDPGSLPSPEDREEAIQKRLGGVPLPAPVDGSPALKAVILKACSFDRADRYSSASDMLDDLMMASEGTMPLLPESDDEMTVAEKTLPQISPADKPVPGSAIQEEKNQNPPAGNSKPAPKLKKILAAVAALLIIAGGAGLLFHKDQPEPEPEPETEQTEESAETEESAQTEDTSGTSSTTAADIDSQMKAELELFLQNLSYCYQTREGSGGAKQYFFTSSDDFGVLQAIMYDLMLSDPDTYNAICPMDIGYRQISTSDGMDPKGLAADHSLSYMEANADAVNWIAKNVFNVYDEGLQDELNFSSGLTKNALFFAPLYLSGGKYYLIPESGGGMGVTISIKEIYLDAGMGDNSGQSYYVRYTSGINMPDGSVDMEEERLAVLDYKTSNGKGYWSLYKDIIAD